MSAERRFWLRLAAVCVGVIALAYLSAFMWGKGSRGFFCPDSLMCRSQSELLVPLAEIPIYRSSYTYYRIELVDYLIREGFWAESGKAEPRWLAISHYNQQWRDGYHPIVWHLGWHGEEWIAWSKNHPQMAAFFWPQVLHALRQDLVDAARLMGAAMGTETMEDLEFQLLMYREETRSRTEAPP